MGTKVSLGTFYLNKRCSEPQVRSLPNGSILLGIQYFNARGIEINYLFPVAEAELRDVTLRVLSNWQDEQVVDVDLYNTSYLGSANGYVVLFEPSGMIRKAG